eukprot:PITA_29631
MKDVGLMHYFLGMEVWQRDGEVFVSQGKYANEILRRFHMEMCKPMEIPLAGNWRKADATSGEVVVATVYRQLVGSLVYLVNTRPNLCFVVNQLSQAMVQPTKLFWKAAKHVLRYLRGTTQYGLWYRRTEGVKLQGFTDADWVSHLFKSRLIQDFANLNSRSLELSGPELSQQLVLCVMKNEEPSPRSMRRDDARP